ncbi:MAG: hypothetical protein ABFR82_10730 [Nitrospirota bacterium]
MEHNWTICCGDRDVFDLRRWVICLYACVTPFLSWQLRQRLRVCSKAILFSSTLVNCGLRWQYLQYGFDDFSRSESPSFIPWTLLS